MRRSLGVKIVKLERHIGIKSHRPICMYEYNYVGAGQCGGTLTNFTWKEHLPGETGR